MDIACGTGRNSIALAEEGYQVTGIDLSEPLLKIARKKNTNKNAVFIEGDVKSMSFAAQFDAAICMWSSFGELPYMLMLDRLRLALIPGGIFVIDTRYYEPLSTNGYKADEHTTNVISPSITVDITDRYHGDMRTREIVYNIDGRVEEDLSITKMLSEKDLIGVMRSRGFQHLTSYYDYKPAKAGAIERIQLIFCLSS